MGDLGLDKTIMKIDYTETGLRCGLEQDRDKRKPLVNTEVTFGFIKHRKFHDRKVFF
jgi:hypothetical protein